LTVIVLLGVLLAIALAFVFLWLAAYGFATILRVLATVLRWILRPKRAKVRRSVQSASPVVSLAPSPENLAARAKKAK
jgi:predicted lipid-binding transport protein (Tim44 family)